MPPDMPSMISPSSSEAAVPARVPCVFVHGWGMNSAVWRHCQAFLPDWLDAVFIDLPGYGRMHDVTAQSLDDYVRAAAAVVTRPAIWVGWSMGALVVLRLAALQPDKVAGVFVPAGTPCFVQRDDWPHAVKPEVFEQFADQLLHDSGQTLKRFLALQVLGVPGSRDVLQQLHTDMTSRGLPTPDALRLGLDVLQHGDLREALAATGVPVAFLLGERDALVPVAVAQQLAALSTRVAVQIQPQAGHAPMVSHPQEFAAALLSFIGALRQ